MRVLIFFAALALFIITAQFIEYLVPLVLSIDPADPARMSDSAYLLSFMERQPPAAFIGIALAHFLGAIVGGLVLGLGKLPKMSAYILGGICTAAGLANLLLLPGHPVWFWVLDLAVYIPGVLLGYAWVERTRSMVAQRQ